MVKITLLFLFILGCSGQQLKYKYTSSNRYLASLTREDLRVSRVEVSLRDEKIFASGMDSTFIIARLFDEEGMLLTGVDPTDLTLSTDTDLEAKPFTFKQGVYKAEVLPRVKSGPIKMRVDWQGQVLSHEIILQTSTRPLKDRLIPIYHEYSESKSTGEVTVSRGSGFPDEATESFSIDNVGDNKIVSTQRHTNAMRSFNFDYAEQARQNILLQVDDAPNGTVSHAMHSIFMFFPRTFIPTVEQLSGTLEVTLPTGEQIVFQKDSKEIVTGVFSEGALDLRADRQKRNFPDLKYTGKGILLRANARGQSPQLGQYGENKIDLEYGLTGSAEVLIINGSTGERCRRPKTDFWEPMDVRPIEFKFPTDKEFETYLKANCGFGLPKL